MGLREYKSRRRFDITPEPGPGPGPRGDHLIFVVHKHAARSLHYDLRLELEGVLKSWAVPKGPSLDPRSKRLAVMVEDHPFDYRDFEGVIPEGNYGAGAVIIWDRGSYHHPEAKDRRQSERLLLEGLRKGNLKLLLEGEKLRGEFALVKTGISEKSWLLLKKKDRFATDREVLADNRSAVSGRTLEELSESGGARSPSGRKRLNRARLREAFETGDLSDAPLSPMPHNISPMLATLAKAPFDDPDWVFEVKWDGYRAVAEVRGGHVSLYSRNGVPLGGRFSPVVDSLRRLGFDALMDGEVVVVDDEGLPDFQALQNYGKTGAGHLLYCVFDLLYLQGHDLTNLPLLRRKEILKNILPRDPGIRFSDHVRKDGVSFFNAAREKGLEGIIAKHSLSPYLPGRRSRQWLKVKTRMTQEGVIAGFTEAGGAGRYFGSLVLGVYEGGELIFIGHSGGGFNQRELKDIHSRLLPLRQERCPFAKEPETSSPVVWVRPELVCEVSFRGWTGEGLMRQPVFLRLRDDKAARDVVKEQAAPAVLRRGKRSG